jgi:hypothetical protein
MLKTHHEDVLVTVEQSPKRHKLGAICRLQHKVEVKTEEVYNMAPQVEKQFTVNQQLQQKL